MGSQSPSAFAEGLFCLRCSILSWGFLVSHTRGVNDLGQRAHYVRRVFQEILFAWQVEVDCEVHAKSGRFARPLVPRGKQEWLCYLREPMRVDWLRKSRARVGATPK